MHILDLFVLLKHKETALLSLARNIDHKVLRPCFVLARQLERHVSLLLPIPDSAVCTFPFYKPSFREVDACDS